jgi:hypothetical protein
MTAQLDRCAQKGCPVRFRSGPSDQPRWCSAHEPVAMSRALLPISGAAVAVPESLAQLSEQAPVLLSSCSPEPAKPSGVPGTPPPTFQAAHTFPCGQESA